MIACGGVMYISRVLCFPISLRSVSIALPTLLSCISCICAYVLAREVKGPGAGLLAAALIAISPGYLSRSTPGNFDNESLALPLTLLTLSFWTLSLKSKTTPPPLLTGLSQSLTLAAWGGGIFLPNLISLHTLLLLIKASGISFRVLYVAYSTYYITSIAMVTAMPWGGELGEGARGEYLGMFGTWTKGSYAVIDPLSTSEQSPLIASVAEHQPASWSSLYHDLHLCLPLFIPGARALLTNCPNISEWDINSFLIFAALASLYCANVMVRLVVLPSGVLAVVAGVGISELLTGLKRLANGYQTRKKTKKNVGRPSSAPVTMGLVTLGVITLLTFHLRHCAYASLRVYSTPSVVLSAQGKGGKHLILDDFREGFAWLKANAKGTGGGKGRVMSWWDYGYQIREMGGQDVLVDNSAWNKSHIATVGRIFASSEEDAYQLLRRYDIQYVWVVFGGRVGYSRDDVSKFLWISRIVEDVYPDHPQAMFLTPSGEYSVDESAPKALLSSLLYKLCYFRFSELTPSNGRPTGFDSARGVEIGSKQIELKFLEEAYTSKHWLVRIYRVRTGMIR
ncbi:hypothetical protein AAMO2058_000629900 [Amorphochlora amoebiformis]